MLPCAAWRRLGFLLCRTATMSCLRTDALVSIVMKHGLSPIQPWAIRLLPPLSAVILSRVRVTLNGVLDWRLDLLTTYGL
jgi:hypothetical protein